jgi:NTE family protein
MAGNKQKTGLVLGGGGMRGLSHVGVLKVLDRAGVTIDLIAGTSMGGVIGALYAAGLAVERIEQEVLALANRASVRRLIDIRLSYRGLVRGERIYNLIADTIGPDIRFADLDIPLAMVAVDARTGCEVVLDTGKVADAVRATISVPGIFQPVETKNMILIDGGILNNVPTNVAHDLGADVVIAADVMPDFSRNTPGQPLVEPAIDPPSLPTILQEAFHIEYIMISAMTRYKLAAHPPDVLIRPAIPSEIDLLIGFERAEEIIATGEEAAEAALPHILDMLASP